MRNMLGNAIGTQLPWRSSGLNCLVDAAGRVCSGVVAALDPQPLPGPCRGMQANTSVRAVPACIQLQQGKAIIAHIMEANPAQAVAFKATPCTSKNHEAATVHSILGEEPLHLGFADLEGRQTGRQRHSTRRERLNIKRVQRDGNPRP